MKYSTCIQKCPKMDEWYERGFYIAGYIPASCFSRDRGGSFIYETEQAALDAILADPEIQANPDHCIQLADCSKYTRP